MIARLRTLLLVAIVGASFGCKEPVAQKKVKAASSAATADAKASTEADAPKLCEHGVPADLCTKCNPDLIPVFKAQGDWCNEHGVPESQCLQCNPDLSFAATAAPQDWCNEHNVPESMCTKCKPALVAKFIAEGDFCREHGFPESVCPFCHPELAKAHGAKPESFPGAGSTVRLASPETARDVGVETTRAAARPIERSLEVVGQLSFDQNRHAELSSRGEALVREVLVDLGDEVKQGQPLVRLASSRVGAEQAQLAAAQARIDAARAKYEREEALAQKGISAQADVEQARRELAAAQAEADTARAALAAAGASSVDASGRYTLVAPFSGTVVARHAVTGKTAASGEVLIEIADLTTMWALLDVPEGDAASVRPGQSVTLRFEGTRTAPLEGKIARVAAMVDPHSRTVRARVELPNPERTLRAGTFLRARIALASGHEALVIPSRAVQHAEGRALVFVKESETTFKPVAVELGVVGGDWVEVTKGLKPGDEVVTTGAFLFKTEILKDSIGAGCCATGEE